MEKTSQAEGPAGAVSLREDQGKLAVPGVLEEKLGGGFWETGME